jgi:hypothetical protein
MIKIGTAAAALALGASLGVQSATAARAEIPRTTDALVEQLFPGKSLQALTWSDKVSLAEAERTALAAAAARELSLRTAGGAVITAEVVDALLYRSPADDTAEEREQRELHWWNDRRVALIRDLVNHGPITVPAVLGSLIEMLDYPGEKTVIPSTALDVLMRLTRRNCGEDFRDQRDRSPERRREVVTWWRGWWERNRELHPIVDAALEERLRSRIEEIHALLIEKFPDYGELRYLTYEGWRVQWREPLVDRAAGTLLFSQPFFRTNPDGTTRLAGPEDRIFVRVVAQFGMPAPGPSDGPRSEPWIRHPDDSLLEAHREVLSGTDIVITVEAASPDAAFLERLKSLEMGSGRAM